MTTPAADAPKLGFLAKFAPFPKPFWVINGVELFERGAYYGMLAVLSVFMTQTLGIPAGQTGILLAIQFPLLYFFPIVAAALADKVGYKAVLVFTFAALIAGYTAIYLAQDFTGILIGVTLFGFGAGAFKPIPAATVSHTTSEADRNFGFSIYYWLINMGAFVFPTTMTLVFGGDYRPYFLVSIAISVLNFVLVMTMWKDIRPANRDIRVVDALKSLSELFKHPAFAVLLVIYSGFWFMYAMTTSFLTVYAVEYGILSPALVPLVVPLNALAIIVLGPILGKMTGKVKSIPLMIAGISIYVGGFVLIGFTGVLALLFAGIVIYSIGEFLTHPGFLSYVSKISPKERVAVFLGYGFIPIGLGQFAGTFAGGFLYETFVTNMGKPDLFWSVISSVGLLTITAMLLYHRAVTPKAERRARRGVPGGTAGALALVALLLAPALVGAGALAPARSAIQTAGADDALGAAFGAIELPSVNGETAAGETAWTDLAIPDDATGALTLVLTWRDEPSQGTASTNSPDSFRLHVRDASGAMVSMSDEAANPQNGEGEIVLVVDGVAPGAWQVGVELVEAGPTTTGAGPLTLPNQQADPGNAWTLAPTVGPRA